MDKILLQVNKIFLLMTNKKFLLVNQKKILTSDDQEMLQKILPQQLLGAKIYHPIYTRFPHKDFLKFLLDIPKMDPLDKEFKNTQDTYRIVQNPRIINY